MNTDKYIKKGCESLYTIGFGGSNHDYSVCLVKDGEILFAIEEERIARKKYGYGINARENRALNYVLKAEGITIDDVSYFASNEILNSDYFYICNCDVIQYNHHLTHAASAYYPSGFREAAILVVDHSGSTFWEKEQLYTETVSYYIAKNGNIKCLQKVKGQGIQNENVVKRPNNSIGYLYSMAAKMLGCVGKYSDGKSHSESGKLMGLSSYGLPIFYNEMSKYAYVSRGIVQIDIMNVKKFIKDKLKEDNSNRTIQNIAASVQRLIEDIIVKCAKHLHSITGCKNICIAGGVGLNGLANQAILNNTKFENIFIQPASNDAGTSVGAALLAYYQYNSNLVYSAKEMKHNFYGVTYSDEYIENKLVENQGIFWKKESAICRKAAELIAEDNIIAWFQGGSEFGPRSLGNRSILANPTNPHMKDILNAKVKFRETYRPYAPSVLKDYQYDYFELKQETNYMLLIPQATEKAKKEIPAVVHVDNTARVQTVSEKFNPKFYKVIQEFYNIKHTPVVLNTSMNIMGEPICETPEDAISCLLKTNIDYLLIGNYLVGKREFV